MVFSRVVQLHCSKPWKDDGFHSESRFRISEEEGVRFGTPFIGSRALAGRLDELLNRQDANGISIRAAIESFGLNPAEMLRAALREIRWLTWNFTSSKVQSWSRLDAGSGGRGHRGSTRMEFVFLGHANTQVLPMHLRHDAIAAAADGS